MKYKISSDTFWNDINEHHSVNGGVYKVVATENEMPVPIQRLLDIDTEGVLYIGKATSFLDRVINLKKSTAPNYVSSNHEFGSRYKEHPLIKEKFSYDNLFIDLHVSETPEELESAELKKYYEKYGELPPLNRRQ